MTEQLSEKSYAQSVNFISSAAWNCGYVLELRVCKKYIDIKVEDSPTKHH